MFDFALGQILPFAVNAVAWYQGESDCSFAESLVCRDVCEDTDIHPKKKQALALRLADILFNFTERR